MFIKTLFLLLFIFSYGNLVHAEDINLKNKLGIKISNYTTPVNLRYWINNSIGIELGGNLKGKGEYQNYEFAHGFLLKIHSFKNVLLEIHPLLHYVYSDYERYKGYELYSKIYFFSEFFFEEVSMNLSFSTGIGVQMQIQSSLKFDSLSLIKGSPFLISVQYYF